MTAIFVSTHPFGEKHPEIRSLLKSYEVTYNKTGRRMTPEETAESLGDSEILIASTEDLGPAVQRGKNLKLICRVGIGLDNVPLELCREKAIRVSYTPDAVTKGVSELTIGLIINSLRQIIINNNNILDHNWNRFIGRRIGTSVIGIVGMGRVGQEVAKLSAAFCPKKILINDIQDRSEQISRINDFYGEGDILESADLDEVLSKSDVITFHTPLTSKTRNLMDMNKLKLLKKDAYLINTSRGEIFNEADLYYALKNNLLAGAALDVFHEEPYRGDLLELQNTIFTAHIGSCTDDCRYNMELEAAKSAVHFIETGEVIGEVPEYISL